MFLGQARVMSFTAVLLFAACAEAICQPSSSATFAFPPTVASGFEVQLVFGNLTLPRGIAFDDNGSLLVVEEGVGVSAFVERNDASCVGWEKTTVVSNTALTHGIQVEGSELYVSSMLQVLLYDYDPRTRSVTGVPTVIVDGLPSDGDLSSRTLLITPADDITPRSLLVSDGPLANIDFTAQDPANGRSQIRRFALGNAIPSNGYVWTGTGAELIAFGIRNAAALSLGLRHPRKLWVGENGASLNTIIGDNASTNNPADELEFVDLNPGQFGRFYGFPFCHTGFDPLPAPWDVAKPGDQFSINSTTGMDNAWCRDPANNDPPRLIFQPHSVPLDMKFYNPSSFWSGGLPHLWAGDAFVSFHGSFDRVPPTGYGVVHVPWRWDGSGPIASPTSTTGYSFLVHVPDLTVCPAQCIRPVGLAFDAQGRLFVSSDTTGEVFYVHWP